VSDAGPPPLLFGPYQPPQTRPGERLFCEVRGSVVVRRFSDGPIPWPRARFPGNPFVICGDLVRALRQESEIAVAHWWGVSPYGVWRWRTALKIPRLTDGTRRLFTDHSRKTLVGRVAAARSVTVRNRISRRRYEQGEPSPFEREWSGLDDNLMGRYSDAEVAARIGCSVGAVQRRRTKLGIPAANPVWPAHRKAKLPSVSGEAVLLRRLALGLTQEQVGGRAGLSVVCISQLERGISKRAKPATLERLSKALECSADALTHRGSPMVSDAAGSSAGVAEATAAVVKKPEPGT
jgi:hypothetical protein